MSLQKVVIWITEVVKHISGGKKNALLLCIDEIMKSRGVTEETKTNPNQIISAVGNCLGHGNFEALITSPHIFATGSGRAIDWVTLNPLAFEEALLLFNSNILFPGSAPENIPNRVAAVIQDCNGHPRSLEYLAKILRDKKSYSAAPPYHELLSSVANSWSSAPAQCLTADRIRPALLQEPVGNFSPISETDPTTFGSLLAEGLYINSVTWKEPIIPILSPLFLYIFAKTNNWKNNIDGDLAKIILGMFEQEPNFNWESFEWFHAHWEWLIRCLFSGKALNLNSLYKGRNKTLLTSVANDLEMVLKHKTRLVKLAETFPSLSNSDALSAKPNISVQDDIMLCATNNPGVDIIMLEQTTASSRNAVIGVKCKYSNVDARTPVSLPEIEKEHQSFKKTFKTGKHCFAILVDE
jgi:hypothetical protein